MTTTATIITADAHRRQFESQGVTGAALDALVAELAPLRHASRVEYAREAAEEYYLDHMRLDRSEVSQITLEMAVAALAYADVAGVGGRCGVDGAATARHPAFAACGKGRKQATDGPAWSAAIESLRGTKYTFAAHGEDHTLILWGRDGDMVVEMMVESLLGTAWSLTVAREGLRRAAGQTPWHWRLPVRATPDTLPAWAAAVNRLMEPAPEQEPEPEPGSEHETYRPIDGPLLVGPDCTGPVGG